MPFEMSQPCVGDRSAREHQNLDPIEPVQVLQGGILGIGIERDAEMIDSAPSLTE